MGGAFVMSIAYALSTDSHVRVDLLYTEGNRHYMNYVDLIGFTLIILPVIAWMTWGLWGYLLEGLRTGERTGSGGWNPVVWPFRVVLVLGFAMFTVQIFAEIVKRIAAVSGKPLDSSETGDRDV
jgi:TRAP-type mannitol/chloroaromatic compound transport system permease small subunit